MKQRLFAYLLIGLFCVSEVSALSVDWRTIDQHIVTSGSNVFSFAKVDFTCQNKFTALTPPSVRKAPQGNYIADFVCTGFNQYDNHCFRESAVNVIDEQDNPACWPGTYHINNLIEKSNFGESTLIMPYINAKYMTDAEFSNMLSPDYSVTYSIDPDVKNGIVLDVPKISYVSQSQTICLTYDNRIMDGLVGGILIKQKNYIFIPANTIQNKGIMFQKDTHQICFTTDSVLGDKQILIVPYVNLTVSNQQKTINYGTFIAPGTEYYLNTKAVQYQDASNTVAVYSQKSTILTKTDNFVSGIIGTILGWFR